MNEFPTGISQSDLSFVVEMVNGSVLDVNRVWTLGHALYEVGADESVLINNASYWFLFDNLNRLDAQLLWVWAQNYRRTGVSPLFM
jgi:hypothetical protein